MHFYTHVRHYYDSVKCESQHLKQKILLLPSKGAIEYFKTVCFLNLNRLLQVQYATEIMLYVCSVLQQTVVTTSIDFLNFSIWPRTFDHTATIRVSGASSHQWKPIEGHKKPRVKKKNPSS